MYNFITIDNSLETLPFPPEVKEIAETLKVDFSKYQWTSYGLPINGGYYSLTGKTLYFEYHPDGKYELTKTEISGNITIGAYFVNPNKELSNYAIVFDLLFLKGELVEVTLGKLEPQDPKLFDQMSLNLKDKLNQVVKRQKSWWYRYLYKNYAFLVRWFFYIVMVFLDILYRGARWCSNKLTPI